MVNKVDESWLEALIAGGKILGGGGGGDAEEGKDYAKIALDYGTQKVESIENLSEDSHVAMVSAVGAPAAEESYVKPAHYVKALKRLIHLVDKPIRGIMTNEMGGLASVNGFIQSAALEIPVMDAAGDGRAHPTGPMGSMGLNRRDDYLSHQVAIGGKRESYVEVSTIGNLAQTSRVVRNAAELAGGLVAVARNPVSIDYVKENAALRVLNFGEKLGRVFIESEGAEERIEAIKAELDGEIVVSGKVSSFQLETQGGFDLGKMSVDDCEIAFLNEYMRLDRKRKRIANFPDLIVVFDLNNGEPVSSAKISSGQEVAVLAVPAEKIGLGAGVKDAELLREAEERLDDLD